MRRALAALALLAGMATAVSAHDFYDFDCCSGRDCAPVDDGQVTESDDGYRLKWRGETVPYGSAKIRYSPDGRYHWCEYPKGSTRCLYVPGRGF